MFLNRVKRFLRPEFYHGWKKKSNFFEIWYFKMVNKTENHSYVFLVGVTMDAKGEKNAFLQVLDGQNKITQYHQFPFEAFHPEKNSASFTLGENSFSLNSIELNLPTIKGKINFITPRIYPSKWYAPSIMGPYSFVPKMECYHHIVSLHHGLQGSLELDGKMIDFTNGRGFFEKDWGLNLPSSYVAMHSNHFTNPDASIKISLAKVPWKKGSFIGFIVAFWLDGQLYRFANYNFSRIKKFEINYKNVSLVIVSKKYKLELLVQRDTGAELVGPVAGIMEGKISESMTTRMDLKLTDRKTKKVIFHEMGDNADLEVCGDFREIQV